MQNMRFNHNLIFAIVSFLVLIGTLPVCALTESEEKEHKDLFRKFVYLQNYGQEADFYAQAALYE